MDDTVGMPAHLHVVFVAWGLGFGPEELAVVLRS